MEEGGVPVVSSSLSRFILRVEEEVAGGKDSNLEVEGREKKESGKKKGRDKKM